MSGKVWIFGDNIDTDLIVPGGLGGATEAERALRVFSANRPGWSAQVTAGDILVAGRNFGTGSSRPAAQMLAALGIACVLAESLNGLFFRNAVNTGFFAFACPGVTQLFEEGQFASISTGRWNVENATTGARLPIAPVLPDLFELMAGGGVIPELERRGLIAPRT